MLIDIDKDESFLRALANILTLTYNIVCVADSNNNLLDTPDVLRDNLASLPFSTIRDAHRTLSSVLTGSGGFARALPVQRQYYYAGENDPNTGEPPVIEIGTYVSPKIFGDNTCASPVYRVIAKREIGRGLPVTVVQLLGYSDDPDKWFRVSSLNVVRRDVIKKRPNRKGVKQHHEGNNCRLRRFPNYSCSGSHR